MFLSLILSYYLLCTLWLASSWLTFVFIRPTFNSGWQKKDCMLLILNNSQNITLFCHIPGRQIEPNIRSFCSQFVWFYYVHLLLPHFQAPACSMYLWDYHYHLGLHSNLGFQWAATKCSIELNQQEVSKWQWQKSGKCMSEVFGSFWNQTYSIFADLFLVAS